MLYSDSSLFTYVQIVVYFLNAAFQFYTSILSDMTCEQGLLRLLWGEGEVGVLRHCICRYETDTCACLGHIDTNYL